MFTFVDQSEPISQTQRMEDEEYGIKPMNCPGHCLLFQSKRRSYNELPIRYADFSPLHRNEISGSLSGLTRLRRFHQDDGHIFCRPAQVGQEIESTLEFLRLVYEAFDLGSYQLVLSTRPETQFIGTISEWERAESQLKTALELSGRPFTIHEGDGAFYGPKIDVILTDLDGKKHQTATIQLDFQLPRRFELEYQCPAPKQEADGIITTDLDLLSQTGRVTPVIIHRAILGSLERFMALLIERYRGHWPFWLSPRQMIILPVYNDPKIHEYVHNLAAELRAPGARHQLRTLDARAFTVDVDLKSRSLAKKVGIAKAKRYNVICVIGDDDMEANMLNLSVYGEPHAKLRRELIESIKPRSQAPPPETSHMDDGYLSVRLTREECTALMMRFCDKYV
jgi:threonyl-tRNA synthetase